MYGFKVGWFAEGLAKDYNWYETRYWRTADDKYYKPTAKLINPEYPLKLKRYKYSAVNLYDYTDKGICVYYDYGQLLSAYKMLKESILEYVDTDKIVVVTGCLVERYLDDLQREIPEVDLFLPIKDYFKFDQKLNQVIENRKLEGQLELSKRVITTKPFSAYLKISDGCSNCCTYCAIPLIRGKFKSFDKQEVLKQAHALKEQGVKELVVISQDTTKYGIDI